MNFVENTCHREHTRLILTSLIPSPETEERTHDAFVQCNTSIHRLVKKNQSFTEFCNLSKVRLGLFWSILSHICKFSLVLTLFSWKHFDQFSYIIAEIIATDLNQNISLNHK